MEAITNFIKESGNMGLVFFGVVATSMVGLWSYKTYLALKNSKNLEYQRFNERWNDTIYDYNKYNDLINRKKDLIIKRKNLIEILNEPNVAVKYNTSITLQMDFEFRNKYQKLNEEAIILTNSRDTMNSAYFEQVIYTENYKNIIKDNFINPKLENLLNLNNLYDAPSMESLKQELYELLSAQKKTNLNAVNVKNNLLFKKIEQSTFIESEKLNTQVDLNLDLYQSLNKNLDYLVETRLSLDFKIKNLNYLSIKHGELISNYNKIATALTKEANCILKTKIKLLDYSIGSLNSQGNALLRINADEFKLLPKSITKENTMLTLNVDELKLLPKLIINENLSDLIKNELWENNEVNKLYLNSNHTYFWLCQENWWNNIKNAYGLNKIPQNNSNLNKLVDTNIEFKPELNIIHLNHNQLDSFYFDLFVFSWQIYFFQHIYLLQYIIPIIYSVIALLVGYVLYKKIKYAYSCYKQKILKVTFLNWLFDPEILFTTSKLGIFYTITIIVLLGILYNFSGFGYWFTFLICGRVFVWNWIKYILYKLKLKNLCKKKLI